VRSTDFRAVIPTGQVAMGNAPLDRMAIERQHKAIQQHHWGVGRDTKGVGDSRRSDANGKALLGLAQQDAVHLCQSDDPVVDAVPLQKARK